MRIAIVSKEDELLPRLHDQFTALGFIISSEPAVIIVAGGDGTLLRAERDYPGIPKALLKHSAIGNLYKDHTVEEIAAALLHNQYTIEEHTALEATVHHVKYRAANDVIIRNKLLTHAIRFRIEVNGVQSPEYVGDGLVIATPFGSTAYYHSITRAHFTHGIGIAFNNIHNERVPAQHFADTVDVLVHITRGPGDLGVDNSLHIEDLRAGDTVRIRKSDVPVRVVRL
jgi:NAD kinase